MNGKKIEKHLYDYSVNGIYCGFLLTEPQMRKLSKIIGKYTSDVKKFLDGEKDNLLVSDWTMAVRYDNPNDKTKITNSKTITYTAENQDMETIQRRIDLFSFPSPKYVDSAWMVKDYDEAKNLVEDLLSEEIEANP